MVRNIFDFRVILHLHVSCKLIFYSTCIDKVYSFVSLWHLMKIVSVFYLSIWFIWWSWCYRLRKLQCWWIRNRWFIIYRKSFILGASDLFCILAWKCFSLCFCYLKVFKSHFISFFMWWLILIVLGKLYFIFVILLIFIFLGFRIRFRLFFLLFFLL